MTLDEQIAATEAVVNAPRQLQRLKMRKLQRDRENERAAWIVKAREVDPEYDAKLEAARAAVAEAEAEVAHHEAARQRIVADRLAGRTDKLGSDGDVETMNVQSGVIDGKAAIAGVYMPRPPLVHQIALERRDLARKYLRRLERFPAELELHHGVVATGETTEQRIRGTRHFSMGPLRIPLRDRPDR